MTISRILCWFGKHDLMRRQTTPAHMSGDRIVPSVTQRKCRRCSHVEPAPTTYTRKLRLPNESDTVQRNG